MTKARSNATANAAKGDLTVGNGTNLSGVLGVGSNGDTIVADSSTSTGLRYTAGTVQTNPVLNAAMQIAQRGTSFAVTAGLYTLDRWQGYRGVAGSTITRQNTSDTTNLPNIQYCARIARNSGNTATNSILFTQDFETINSIPFAGKTVTLSFYARAGANYSATSSILYGAIITGTGTDQNNTTGSYTGAAQSLGANVNLTTTWQRFTMTGTIPTTSTEMEVKFAFDPTGTAGANDYFEITGVQIDIGSVALPFRTNAGTIQGELAACMRYYEKTYIQAHAPATVTEDGAASHPLIGSNTTGYLLHFRTYKVEKRGTPTITLYDYAGNSGKCSVINGTTTVATNNITATADTVTSSSFRIFENGTSCGGYGYHYVASAEL